MKALFWDLSSTQKEFFMKIVFIVLVFSLFSHTANLSPNKTHAVLNVFYTNFQDVPQIHKKLTFVPTKNPSKKIIVNTDQYGEASFLIPREDSYVILCESLTGPFECGETPYVSLTASSGEVNGLFDDTRAELTGVMFKAGSAELVESSLKTLNNAIKGLKMNPKVKIEISGHTSSEGGEELNQKLSEDRANSVRSYMIANGIESTRLVAVGCGFSRPKSSNDTEAGRAQNRRIELSIIEE